ncbi:MAG: triple tyrosine motif-containing protein [Bacteroidales bacterium]|nr:triple tyrosine motif-containing protein [Bacteroidales bacterium]
MLTIFFLFLPLLLSAQVKEIGTPFIKNYPRKVTQAGQQNWMIDQDSNGIMYFANNEGLLEFNGFDWSVNPLPNHSIIRSLKVIKDKVYVGGFNELGYFKRDHSGSLQYNSLIDLIPDRIRDFSDIWKIHSIGKDIVFQSFKYILYFNGTEFYRIIPAPVLFHFSYSLGGELYVNDIENGMYRVAPEKLVLLPGLELLKGKEIWGMEALNDGILFATANDGLFLYKNFVVQEWKIEASSFLKKNQIYSMLRLSDNMLAFGTIQNGLLISDNSGRIIKTLNRENGIQNNTILSLRQDINSNLWLGLDNGIDYLQINSPFSYFSHSDGLSAGYTSAIYQGKLYLGTNQGVFVESWSALKGGEGNSSFSIIEETRGQVWSLNVIDDKLFCGHNKGFLQIENTQAKVICEKPGGWMLSQTPSNKNIMIGGTYNGFVLFKKSNDQWKYFKEIDGFEESARVFEWENTNTLWMSHGFKGIYKIQFSPNYDSVLQFELFGENRGLPSDFSLEINNWDGEIIVSSSSGLYTFNYEKQEFYLDQEKTDLFEGRLPLKLIKDKDQNIWYFSDENLGVLRMQEDGNYSSITTPFTTLSNNYIDGFQHLNAIDGNNVIFGSDNGFIHYDPGISKSYDYPFQTYISQIGFLKKDSILSNTNLIDCNICSNPFKSKENHFVFNFGASDYENTDNLRFSAFLEGYDEEWDSWSDKRNREFTNLHEGQYTFRVRAKNGFNTISNQASYAFLILPPWYKTWWAYLIYVGLFGIFIYFIAYFIKQQARILKRKEKIEQLRLHRQNESKIKSEKLHAEKELIRLKNDQLRSEMLAKDKELANSTLQMIQKNKLLNRLKLELDNMNAKTNDDLIRNHNKALIRRINREIEDKNHWIVFEEHFEAVHEEFLKRLREQYPDLTPKERKLAAYLRLNISTKEIALLMNISARGVEIARYRLRKKFNLDRSINLLDFILKF